MRNPLDYVGRKYKELDDYVAREAASRAMRIRPEIEKSRAAGKADRASEIQGRGQNEKTDMVMNILADAKRQQGDLSKGAVLDYQMSPVNLGAVGKALGMKGANSPKGNFAAPDLSEAEVRQLVQAMPSGGRAFGEAVANYESDNMGTKSMMLRQQLDENLADRGTKGKLSRGAMYAGIGGGITASGAALIDLMKFLTQGQQVDAQRDDVLQS